MEYAKARDLIPIDSLDLVFFSGHGFISRGIKFVTRSKWSHVGVVWRIHNADLVLLIESTTLSKVPDVYSGEGRKGFQIVPLRQRFDTYVGTIGVRHWVGDRPEDLDKRINRLRHRFRGVLYEKRELELVASALPWPVFRENTHTLFCSEVGAEIHQEFGLIPEKVPSNSFSPAELSEYIPMIGSFDDMVILE
jgi:hypothetical protein